MAGTCCDAHVILRGRPFSSTSTTGLPVATAASRSCCCRPGSVSVEREARSPLMFCASPSTSTATCGLLHQIDGMIELRIPLCVGLQRRLRAGKLAVEDRGLAALDLHALCPRHGCVRTEALADTFKHRDCVGGMPGQTPRTHNVRLRIRQRPNHRNRFERLTERKQTALIAQQHGGSFRRYSGCLPLFGSDKFCRRLRRDRHTDG